MQPQVNDKALLAKIEPHTSELSFFSICFLNKTSIIEFPAGITLNGIAFRYLIPCSTTLLLSLVVPLSYVFFSSSPLINVCSVLTITLVFFATSNISLLILFSF